MEVNGNSLQEFTSLNDVPSGEELGYNISLAIVDVYDNIINNLDSNSILISAVASTSHVKATNTASLSKGRAIFKNLILESSPGDEDISFKLTSSAINYDLVQYLDPVKYADLIIK